MQKLLIVIVGPTAVGKTDLSIDFAKNYNAEIISADSRQFYKELSIGTAVPTNDQLNSVKHNFIHNKSIHEYYNAYKYEQDVIEFLQQYYKTHDKAIMTGGSGMYIDAVCNGIDLIPDIDDKLRNSLIERMENEGVESLRFELKKLDPEFYKLVDLKNKQRILRALEVCIQTGKPFSSFRTKSKKEREFKIIKIGLNRDREELYDRINHRVDIMIESGLVKEARSVEQYKNAYALKTVGYRELFAHFNGEYDLNKAIELIKRNTRHFARRQLTWFNKDKEIVWFHPDDKSEILEQISKNQ